MTNANADDYAAARQNVFFTANDQTSADGNLTGQCVTLLKWFFQDMCNGFPAPFAARGNAKDVGHTLVAQGLATEVPYSDRRRGDVICYEYGTYGHIASQLSGGRVFEENVNWSGVASKVVDGETVYASRIGNENEAWRSTRNPHVYRLKNYSEGGDMDIFNEGDRQNLISRLGNKDEGQYKDMVGKRTYKEAYESVASAFFVNGGDVVNFNNIAAGLGDAAKDKAYKRVLYEDVPKFVGSQQFVAYETPQLFVKKGN